MFITPRWRKVVRDLWLNKLRTILVVFSIAVGVFAVGVITNARIVLAENLQSVYLATNPAHATILALTAFDEDLVESVRNIEEVGEAEARRSVSVRVEIGPDEWKNLFLIALPDYEDIKVTKVSPESGEWPPPEREILVERSALSLIQAQVGQQVTIKTPSGKLRQMKITGTTHDMQASLYVLSDIGYGHISVDTLEWLEEPRNFNELHIRVAENELDRTHIKAVTNLVQDKLEEAGIAVLFTLIPQPNQPPVDYLIQAVLAILGAVGVLSLGLSGFLVINTVSAIITQQIRQIGVMKTIGATTRQLVAMYLITVLMFGLLALLVALPLGAVSAFFFTRFMAGLLNFDIQTFEIPPLAFALQVAIALLVPFLTGLMPVFAGVRITVQEAISEQGLGKGRFGASLIDRWLTGGLSRVILRWLSRPTLISIRNTFRRKKRLILTLATLVMGGTIFIAVSSLQASLRSTLDSWLEYFQYDVAVQMGRPYRVERVRRVLLEVPGVVDAEGWSFYTARRVRPDGSIGDSLTIFAPRADTRVVRPTLVRGRWLLPEDDNAIVINTITLRNESDIEVGDEIILKIEGQEKPWRVVGLVQGGTLTPTGFISYEMLSEELGQVGQAEWMMVIGEAHSPDDQNDLSRAITDHLTASGFRVGITGTASQDKQTIEVLFQIIFILLLVVAVVLAIVGGLGLMGTMSINVLERTREIGVMRAVGASNGSILKIILFEGMFIGAISWLIGASIALPISKVMSDAVGTLFISSELNYTFSVQGTTVWLILIVVLALIASFFPRLERRPTDGSPGVGV